MKIKKILEQLISKEDLAEHDVNRVMTACMAGKLDDIQLASFLSLIRAKGETVDELTAAANIIWKNAQKIDLGQDLLDIVGTGGDGKNTFNISTVSSFVASACGELVAKHGNYSVSSQSGSANLLLEAGFKLNLPDKAYKRCMDTCGIVFLFAPHFHQAIHHAKAARKGLGIRTLFNLLGPLLNPAQASNQIVGVYPKTLLTSIADVLTNLGNKNALVVSSDDGLDEISICANTTIVECRNETIRSWVLNPKDYDCFHPSLKPILVKNPTESLALAEAVFSGKHGAARDIIILNSAAAVYCAKKVLSFEQAIKKVTQVIDNGDAGKRFDQLKQLTQELSND